MPPPADLPRYLIAGVLFVLLIWAAISDIRTRRIPNAVVLAAMVLFAPWVFLAHGTALGSGLAAAGIGFGVGYVLYLFGTMGAGDVKLFAAVALFTGLAYLPLFALATVLSGGVLAAVMVALNPQRGMVMFAMKGQGDFGRGIPYGVAIAFGGVAVIAGALTGWLPADLLFGGRA